MKCSGVRLVVHLQFEFTGHCDLMGLIQGIDYEKKENVLGGCSAVSVDRLCILV